MRPFPCPARAILLLLLAALPAPAGAQLRPLSPFDWAAADSARGGYARLGLGAFQRQRASLAGTEGELLEIGDFSLAWRSGRVVVEAGGTLLRLFADQRTFAPPHGGAQPQAGSRRRDTGDYRIATIVLLTPPQRPAAAILRFGTRLPTTDNRIGLERDRTDFFALLGGRVRRAGLHLGAEAGVGIHGTRDPDYEQSDVLLYSLSASYPRGRVTPGLLLVGHMDGRPNTAVRGNEELAELRLGARLGGRIWADVQLVRGLLDFSPRSGVLLAAGTRW